jgi:hypothetical protein
LIALLVYIDVPLEIALARRLLRISSLISQGNSDVTIEEHLLWYLGAGRNFYVAVERNTERNVTLLLTEYFQLMK